MKIFKYIALVVILLQVSCGKSQGNDKELGEIYVQSVSQPVINLNGTWKINLQPEDEFWKKGQIDSTWKDIQVPSEAMMQGFPIKHDVPFAYKKEISIPGDYGGKNIYLQFDGVYSYAKVWVNGNFIRDHHGGFTRWNCDITPYVKAGNTAKVTVEVTDRVDEISYASGYAKHPIGGILRDVNLLALPKNHPTKIIVETKFDNSYTDAQLLIKGDLRKAGNNSELTVHLFDSDNKEITLANNKVELENLDSFSINNKVLKPEKWDAEHPNLYTLQFSFYEKGQLVWSKKQKIGFRQIKVADNSFLINGEPVKLRGANRHDVHPTLGRVSTQEYELKDVMLAKEANINYIRTSHYPPTESFLKLCDEYGLYVEDETAVCFILDYRIKGYEAAGTSQSDPKYTDRYLSQLKEMVDAHRNHASVVIWSIGNESNYGLNFQKSYEWVKNNDETRPIKFSYPGTAQDSAIADPYDILSMHYQELDGSLEQRGIEVKNYGYNEMPVVFDEWAHVACYNNETIIEDPNIRSFWGQSLDIMWKGIIESNGGLGGGIWGMIDETFMLPVDLEGFRVDWGKNDKSIQSYAGTTVGYGEWGIIDTWRRKKPEFWNTKKAYSPIRLLNTSIAEYKLGDNISLPIHNRFDHTNLNETTIEYTYKSSSNMLPPPDIEPHNTGTLELPIKDWNKDEKITINFYDENKNLIDSYIIQQQADEKIQKSFSTDAVTLIDSDASLIINTQKGDFNFDKKSGLISHIKNGDQILNISGPKMVYRTKGEQVLQSANAINDYGKDWKLEKFKHRKEKNKVVVNVKGNYGKITTEFEIAVYADGTIDTNYNFQNLPNDQLREVGLMYEFDNVFDSIAWKRKGYWSNYPENHLSALSGKANLYTNDLTKYQQKPEKPWNQDVKSFYYEGTDDETKTSLTHIAKATKENIFNYNLRGDSNTEVNVIANGDRSCRLMKTANGLTLTILKDLDYVDLDWGNYERNIQLDGAYSGSARIETKL